MKLQTNPDWFEAEMSLWKVEAEYRLKKTIQSPMKEED